MRSSSSSSEVELASSGTSRRNRCASFTREFSRRRPPRGGRRPARGCADTVAEDNAGTPSAARCLASSCCLRRLCCCISALPNLPTRGRCIGDGEAMVSARVAARQQNSWERNRIPGTPFRRHRGPLKSQPRTGHTREPCICTFPHVPLALHSPPLGYFQCFKGRLEGWSAAPAVNTQDLSGRVEHPHACSRGPFPRSRFAHACCARSSVAQCSSLSVLSRFLHLRSQKRTPLTQRTRSFRCNSSLRPP